MTQAERSAVLNSISSVALAVSRIARLVDLLEASEAPQRLIIEQITHDLAHICDTQKVLLVLVRQIVN